MMSTAAEREARDLLIGARVRDLQARYYGSCTPEGREYLLAAERSRKTAAKLGYRSL